MSPRAAWRLESFGFRDVHDYTSGKADWLGAGLPTEGRRAHPPRVIAVLDRSVATCAPNETVGAVASRIGPTPALCVVVNDVGVVQGRLRRDRLDPTDVRPVEVAMEPGPTTIRADADVAETTNRMRARGVPILIVTDPDGVLVGLFTPGA